MHLLGPVPIINNKFKKKENYTDIDGNCAERGRRVNGDDIVLDKKDLVSGKLLINEKLQEQAITQMRLLKKWHDRCIYLF
jgi:hypothetical protein